MLVVPLSSLSITPAEFRAKALHWAACFQYCAYYEPNDLPYPQGAFSRLLGVRATAAPAPATLNELRAWLDQSTNAPRCGILSYELKNQIECLNSHHFDSLSFPDLHFFEPESWLIWHSDSVEIHGLGGIFDEILAISVPAPAAASVPQMRARMPRGSYLAAVAAIQEDILNGEVYELNLCQEFYAEHVDIEPVSTFLQLNSASPTPFAGFYKWQDQYLLCASPERFLRQQHDVLLSQPIKGTIRRGLTAEEDEELRQQLRQNEKEQAENLMIVDLVRNDLARVAVTGSVQVPELFGLYSFRHVWQMISTVQARRRPECDLVDTLRATFPMGSMTGAPKIRAMQFIEQYEHSRRGLYSGSLGVIWPSGDFDFNVVIRSLQFNAATGYLSFQVGSAITYDSIPELEYEECLLKAKAMLEVLGAEVV
ncbi:Chorismate binding-like [Hymenobacter roseosalivarius DSM 11622]|uniref:Chorismate binding-like n=1 Tax=Hymenobacter roseosalivarius DSM 11622 TaxID=645990 RepID=A0A1W1W003_9BACT|nr:anthranilate synthase component I family protein [Hymenobacter roseosalivarius]SMB98962.1 Chorismate binding-like [Hymenobacter roseosalivarius DSM 11622]